MVVANSRCAGRYFASFAKFTLRECRQALIASDTVCWALRGGFHEERRLERRVLLFPNCTRGQRLSTWQTPSQNGQGLGTGSGRCGLRQYAT
jgi:hypothetical protein